MPEKKQKIYSREFKESSVRLAIESAQPIAHTARELGINENTLYSWVGKYSHPLIPANQRTIMTTALMMK